MEDLLKAVLSRTGNVEVSRSTAVNPVLWAFGLGCAVMVPASMFSSDQFWKGAVLDNSIMCYVGWDEKEQIGLA
jgi:hypothetical protein